MSDSTADHAVVEVPARLRFGGHDPAPARARVAERSSRWRTLGALRQLLLWWGLGLLVVWIPPHFPWLLIALAVGAIRAFGRYTESRTLLGLHGACPKCGVEQDFPAGVPLKRAATVRCANCKWDLKLDLASAQTGPGAGSAPGK